jgi:hypothetical protein
MYRLWNVAKGLPFDVAGVRTIEVAGSNTIDLRSCFSFRFAMIFSLSPENTARGANPSSLLIEIAALLRSHHH